MKNFKNVFKKVTVVMLVAAFIASVGCNVYQYCQNKYLIDTYDEMTDVIDSSWEEASAKMSISDKLLFESVIERNLGDFLERKGIK